MSASTPCSESRVSPGLEVVFPQRSCTTPEEAIAFLNEVEDCIRQVWGHGPLLGYAIRRLESAQNCINEAEGQ